MREVPKRMQQSIKMRLFDTDRRTVCVPVRAKCNLPITSHVINPFSRQI